MVAETVMLHVITYKLEIQLFIRELPVSRHRGSKYHLNSRIHANTLLTGFYCSKTRSYAQVSPSESFKLPLV
jgi:hypothetical protein